MADLDFEKVERVIAGIRDEWLADPNVMDIGPALKVSGGVVQTDTLAIGFRVAEKLPEEVLEDRGSRPIPPEIEGVPTDVIVARGQALGSVDVKDTRSQLFDTLIGGIAVGNADMNAYGTLGMVLLAQSDGRMVGLTNEHVLVFDIDGQVGDEVQQPRFYMNSEVSLDDADCCPDGQLRYRGVDNPIVDVAAGVFAAAAIAAAASDEIDPHRRGQDATVPEADERTLRETVSIAIEYPEIPFPGRPYEVGVDWTYRRETDRRELEHAVTERNTNPHALTGQHLLTDRRQYRRGETVSLLGLLGTDRPCASYFVTAAVLSPSHRRGYKTILRPRPSVIEALAHGDASHRLENSVVRRCRDFRRQRERDSFTRPRRIDGLTYDPRRGTAIFLRPASRAPLCLRFPNRGLVVRLPSPVEPGLSAKLWVLGSGVRLTAYNAAGVEVDRATASPSRQPVTVEVRGADITTLLFEGGSNEAYLEELCLLREIGPVCAYAGEIELAPDEEPGVWTTYLFAQTLNDVPAGADPVDAAPTIGGLPVTDNFVDAGRSYNITYGFSCNVEPRPDGDFVVG